MTTTQLIFVGVRGSNNHTASTSTKWYKIYGHESVKDVLRVHAVKHVERIASDCTPDDVGIFQLSPSGQVTHSDAPCRHQWESVLCDLTTRVVWERVAKCTEW